MRSVTAVPFKTFWTGKLCAVISVTEIAIMRKPYALGKKDVSSRCAIQDNFEVAELAF